MNTYHVWLTFNNSSSIPVWNEVLTLSVSPENSRCGFNGALQFALIKYGLADNFAYMMYFAADSGVIGCQNSDIPSGRYYIDLWF